LFSPRYREGPVYAQGAFPRIEKVGVGEVSPG
jgi:hypothetical protein